MIRYDLRGDAAWITLDRPEKLNALDLAGWTALSEALDRAASEARVAVLTGSGDAFCAGDDIAVLDAMDDRETVEEMADALFAGLYGVESLSIPVVAAVDGLAYGGGFELVMAADLAVATERASFALPETRIGAFPPYAVSRIAETGGRKRLLELVLTGEPIDATTALEWGLLNRVVSSDDLPDAVATLVEAIVASPRSATWVAKAYATQCLRVGDERERIVGGFAQVVLDEDCRAAMRAFLDR